VLHKPGRLDAEEWAQVMAHPVTGYQICRRLATARPVLDCILYHHERFDGSGYPERLRGEAIPYAARLLGVADAFDALTSARAYRRSLEPGEALDLLRQETGLGKWDPALFAALEAIVGRGEVELRR
jgi:HD-GYP domain-containing protein (c-di-GMP phosphodiesterase class II)